MIQKIYITPYAFCDGEFRITEIKHSLLQFCKRLFRCVESHDDRKQSIAKSTVAVNTGIIFLIQVLHSSQ